jgi:hypothetical protein
VDWIEIAQYRVRRLAVVNAVMNNWVDLLYEYQFDNKDSAAWS